MCICVQNPDSSTHLGQPLVPKSPNLVHISTFTSRRDKHTTHRSWISPSFSHFHSCKLLIIPEFERRSYMFCYFPVAHTLCIVLTRTRLAADVRSEASCQFWGHSSVTLFGKEITACSFHLKGHAAMQENVEIPWTFPPCAVLLCSPAECCRTEFWRSFLTEGPKWSEDTRLVVQWTQLRLITINKLKDQMTNVCLYHMTDLKNRESYTTHLTF